MKQRAIIRLIFTAMFILSMAWGQAFGQQENRYELNISNGYRFDKFDWSIAGGGVNVLSELTWKDLRIYEVNAGGKLLLGASSPLPLYMRANGGYGWILSGDNQDSDFNGNNRTLEYSRSNNNGGGGNVLDLSGGAGIPAIFGGGRFVIAPLIGYSYNEQNLEISDGFQTIPATGPFQGLHSTYKTEWRGPWTGVDLEFQLSRTVGIHGAFEYHWADYDGVGDWNLRPDFAHPKSFEQKADGHGVVAKGGVDVALTRNWSANADFGYQSWATDAGTDETFFPDGSSTITRFNGANLESFSAMAGLTYRFR